MSLSALPTEIDDKIFGFLDQCDLYAVSLTSKYYHKIAEPIMYAHPCFRAEREVYAKSLILTLFKRPELAAYIKTIRFEPSDKKEPYVDASIRIRREAARQVAMKNLAERLMEECWVFVPTIYKIIDTTWPELDVEYKQEWLSGFLQTALDAHLALILTLAPNIQTIDYHCSNGTPMSIVSGLLSHYASAPRFPKLKEVLGHGYMTKAYVSHFETPFFVCPPVESLYLAHLNIIHFEDVFSRPQGCIPTLRSVELLDVQISPENLIDNFRSGFFRNVERLSLRRLSEEGWWYWCETSLEVFTQSLVEHLPELRDLELTISNCESFEDDSQKATIPFGSLKDLKKLVSMTVDLDLILDSDCKSAPSRFFSLHSTHLPNSIETVTFTNVKPAFLSQVANISHDTFSQIKTTCPRLELLALHTFALPDSNVRRVFEEYSSIAAESGLLFELETVARNYDDGIWFDD